MQSAGQIAVAETGASEALALLDEIGLASPSSLSQEELMLCISTKNAARKDVHSLVGKFDAYIR